MNLITDFRRRSGGGDTHEDLDASFHANSKRVGDVYVVMTLQKCTGVSSACRQPTARIVDENKVVRHCLGALKNLQISVRRDAILGLCLEVILYSFVP